MEPLAVTGDGLVLERVVVVELLGRLHQRHARIVEVADGADQEVRVRDVVGVQHRHEVGLDDRQGVVEVAGLRVRVLLAGEVPHAEVPGQAPDLRPVAVVEHPGLVAEAHRGGRRDGRDQDLDALVVGGHEDRDARSGCG